MENMTVKEMLEATGGTLLCGSQDTPLRCISLDSRNMKGGDLFVPLLGEKVDSHRFIGQAFENGAAASLTSEEISGSFEGKALIRVADTKKALQDIGRYMRNRLSLPLVGVTGSVGKTTTREMIAAALSAGFQVFKTRANQNSQVGVPITISEISKDDQVGVIELGMSEPGELTVIAKIARIDMAVITNIGIAHIEQLGSRENIRREKLTIQDGLKDGGVLILNGDDDMLKDIKGRDGIRTVTYGMGETCDFKAEDIRLLDGRTEFTAVYGESRCPVKLRVMGLHNVSNAMAAMAVCVLMGMSMEQAAAGLSTFTGFAHRQQVYAGARMTILDDSYNASPASMEAAIDVFLTLKKGSRHVAVLADMKELGEKTEEAHREVGEYAGRAGLDLIVTLGPSCHILADSVRAVSDTEIVEFEDKEELKRFLENELSEGDCVLIKGSNSMGLFELADRLKEAAGPEV